MTARETVVYDVNDFKVWALTADTSGSPTYSASAIDVPGIAEVSMEPNLLTNELLGDARIIAKKGRIDKFNFSATYGRIALNAMPVFLGGSTYDIVGGVQWGMPGNNALPYFKAAFQISNAEVEDVHIVAYKCQVTGGTLLSQSSNEFGQPSIDFEAIPSTANDNLFLNIRFLDAETALSG